MSLPGPCPTCAQHLGPDAGHCQPNRDSTRWEGDMPFEEELGTDTEPARIPAARLIGGPRHCLPAWWYELLLGREARRLDIVLERVYRVGLTIDGEAALNGKHDILRWPDGRFQIVECGAKP